MGSGGEPVMPEEKTTPDYTGWKLTDGCLCCPRCLARIVIKEREPYITMILRVADEHVCYAEAKIMYAAKSAAWRLPPASREPPGKPSQMLDTARPGSPRQQRLHGAKYRCN